MRWQLGADGVTESTQIAAVKPGVMHPPMTVTIDNFDPRHAHATVMFNDDCEITDLAELDSTSGTCSFTIQSDHAKLMVILPIRLAKLLVSIDAAHRDWVAGEQLDADMRERRLRLADDAS